MPQFPWQKSFSRSSRPSQPSSYYVEGQQQQQQQQQQQPDLPLPSGTRSHISRSTSVTERHGHFLDNRRSIALFTNPNTSSSTTDTTTKHTAPTDSYLPHQSPPSSNITRAQTVAYRNRDTEYEQATPSPLWQSGFQLLPTSNEQSEAYQEEELASMNSNNVQGKTSSDSGSATGLDRWSQRRLQRLNTEQGFREQRQAGNGGNILSPVPGNEHSYQQNSNNTTFDPLTQPQIQPQQQSRTGSNAALGLQSSSNNNTHSRSPNTTYSSHDPSPHQQQYSPPDAQYQSLSGNGHRGQSQQTRSYQSNSNVTDSDAVMSASANNGSSAAAKAARAGLMNRQSVHTDLLAREGSGVSTQGIPAFNASVVPPVSQDPLYSSDSTSQQQNPQADPRRPTPQPTTASEDMTEEEINNLIKDHKELREKYTKVKKYYFEKEDQVKQLQNSLAHQRLSQSRTSLDDSEYTTRFNRLDGLVAQLAFSIRKSWRSLPPWLANYVNKDAVTTGKQEMTAAGRSFISWWLVEEVFDKYFHPDLEPALSAQLKSIQRNIRRFATPAQTLEEENYLIAKVVNWRLATLEGLQDALRSPQCPVFRTQMTDMLKEHLCGALTTHLQDPPPPDLEGGVHMIVELVVSIAIHLPLESRDVVIEYFMPGNNIVPDQMKLETGIPALTISIADDAADRASMKSATSDVDNDSSHEQQQPPSKKRGMLSALTGSVNKNTRSAPQQQQQKTSAGASSSSLQRPESSAGKDESPRVRMAAGIGVSIRGKSVLVKAPVFST